MRQQLHMNKSLTLAALLLAPLPFVTLTLILFILASCACSAAEKTGDLNIQVDFATGIGTLKALNGVNGGPRTVGRHSGDLVTLHKEAGFPSVRLHDCNWPHPDVVDIPAIFPLFHLDADDPKNYQFAKTDAYIKPIIENGASILFRMGVSIEHKAPRFHVAPPEDFEKWTKICVNILRHYNDGWADGFHYNIRHVEIWNEIAGKEMWSGTQEQYFDLYRAAVTGIKKYNPKIKVGGPVASAVESPEVIPFLAYCQKHKLPLDFFSWHSYGTETEEPLIKRAHEARSLLDEYGFKETESWCTEWKRVLTGWKELRWRKDAPRHTVRMALERNRNHEAAAYIAAGLMQMQDAPVDMAYFYSADDSHWSMFDVYGEPGRAYFAMKAFHQFLQAPHRVKVTGAPGEDEITVGAGLTTEKDEAMILASNFRSEIRKVRIDLQNLPWKGKVKVASWRIDKDNEYLAAPMYEIGAGDQVIELNLPAGTVVLLRLQTM